MRGVGRLRVLHVRDNQLETLSGVEQSDFRQLTYLNLRYAYLISGTPTLTSGTPTSVLGTPALVSGIFMPSSWSRVSATYLKIHSVQH